MTRDRDRSGEAGETALAGSTAGKSPGREAASPDLQGGGVDSSPAAVAAAHKWLLAVAETDDLPGLQAAAALLSRVATERDEARARFAETRPLLLKAVAWQEYAERMERDADVTLAEEVQRLRREKPAAEARADTASRQLAEARAALQAFHIAFVGYMTPDEINERLTPDQIEAAARALLSGETP